MRLGDIEIQGKAILAPMAGVADTAFRILARSFGAALTYTELVSSDGLVRRSPKTFDLIRLREEERPIGIQIFGSDPVQMGEAAAVADEAKPDLIDLNFGCPARKVVHRGAGAALLIDLPRMRAIVKAVVASTQRPVTGKIRSGWSQDNVAAKAARILEEEGARAVTVHARTRTMKFEGRSDWKIIRQVKEAVSIPVVGNGDIRTHQDAVAMLQETSCDLIMVGRGVMGKPWLFSDIGKALNGEEVLEPSVEERISVCIRHYKLACSILGVERAVLEMRKHIGWYVKGMEDSSRLRQAVFQMANPNEVLSTLRNYSKQLMSRKAGGRQP